MTASPPWKLWVSSSVQPTIDGPRKPPRLPTELISAMPPAAAVLVRKIGGSPQNGPSVA